MKEAIIEIQGLTKEFPAINKSHGKGLVAVDHVTLSIAQGEVFGVVGESGSGKSTLARCIFGITPATSGRVKLFGETLADKTRKEQRDLRANLGFVFQDPIASLNPRMRIRDVIAEPLELHSRDKGFIDERVNSLIERVGLSKVHLDRRAHQLSGGQCQRVAIARALSTNPKAILLDEPTSSLDLSVQAQILNLLEDLRKEYGLTYFLISHNLDVISHLSDRIAVMSAGKIVEIGESRRIMENPRHPFTRNLVQAREAESLTSTDEVPEFDLEMWQEAPLNRWAFQHVEDFLHTAQIEPSPTPFVWTKNENRGIDNLTVQFDGTESNMDSYLSDLYTDALLVVKDGEIVFEKYYNGMTQSTPHLLQSVSKSVLGILVGQLIEEGILDREEKLGTYIPALKGSGYFDATVQDALDMTVSLIFSEEYHNADSEIQRLDRVSGWRHRRVGDQEGIRTFITSIKKNTNHGKQFQYCSANTDLLAWVCSEVTGTSYPDLISRRLWKAIGASTAASITVDDLGDVLANGGLSTTARDLALIGQVMLNKGEISDHQVISDEWIVDTARGAPAGVASVDYMQALHPGGSYRNQWWITNGSHQEIYGVGIYGQYLWVDPVSRTVIVKFSTLPIATSAEHSRRHMALFKTLSGL